MNWTVVDECCPDCFGVGSTKPHLDNEICRRCWGVGVVERIAGPYVPSRTAEKAPLAASHGGPVSRDG